MITQPTGVIPRNVPPATAAVPAPAVPAPAVAAPAVAAPPLSTRNPAAGARKAGLTLGFGASVVFTFPGALASWLPSPGFSSPSAMVSSLDVHPAAIAVAHDAAALGAHVDR